MVREQSVAPDDRTITDDEKEAELQRFQDAVAKAREELLPLAAKNEIFAAHHTLAGDIALYESRRATSTSCSLRAWRMSTCASGPPICGTWPSAFCTP